MTIDFPVLELATFAGVLGISITTPTPGALGSGRAGGNTKLTFLLGFVFGS